MLRYIIELGYEIVKQARDDGTPRWNFKFFDRPSRSISPISKGFFVVRKDTLLQTGIET